LQASIDKSYFSLKEIQSYATFERVPLTRSLEAVHGYKTMIFVNI